MKVKKSNIQFKVKVPLGLKPIVRERVADKIIDYVRQRTSSGRDKDESSFPSYSKEYKESDDFKIAGKSSMVNLKLSGDMMDTLSLVTHTDGELTIGYTLSDDIAGRVEGNVIGSYGKPTGNSSKARNFLGIQKSKIDLIVSEVTNALNQESITEVSKENEKKINNLLNKFINSIVLNPETKKGE